jgi:diadenylate cyclase
MEIISKPIPIKLSDIFEILILSIIFYYIFMLFRKTRLIHVLKFLGILLIVSFLAQKLNFHTINWILKSFWAAWPLAFVIIFHPEIRRLITRLGESQIWTLLRREEKLADEIIKSVRFLSHSKMGALIAIERNVELQPFIESGVKIDAEVSKELLNSIFNPTSELHDGAVIIVNNRIAAAGCILPLSQNPNMVMTRPYGTRHLAAIGLTEETDAIVIAVSEETGSVSLAVGGRIANDLSEDMLAEMLALYGTKTPKAFELEEEESS